MSYSVKPRDWIFDKDHGFSIFTKNMYENLGKNINNILIGKYSHLFLIMFSNLQLNLLLIHLKLLLKTALKSLINLD